MQTIYIGNTLINDIWLGNKPIDVPTSYAPYDNDAQNFINATGIVGVEAGAINRMVIDLKSNNLWNKFNAIYPFVGGNSSSNRFNLINTGSYLLAFTGSWNYSSNGVSGSASNAHINTSLDLSVVNTNYGTDGHLSVYVRNNVTGGYDMGVEDDFNRSTYLISRYVNNLSYYNVNNTLTSASLSATGFYMGTNSGSSGTNMFLYKNGTTIASRNNTNTAAPQFNLFIAGNNVDNISVNERSPRNYAFASIGLGINSTEASTFYTIVQNFQTTLGRQV